MRFINAAADLEVARLHPALVPVVQAILSACRAAGWPVEIRALGGFRTEAQQAALYAQGRTAPGRIVTYVQHSKHQDGLAFDLDLTGYPREAGMALWRFLGGWWMSLGGRWGGTWRDFSHFEL